MCQKGSTMTFLACLKLDYIMIENFECDHVKQVSLNSKDSVIFHSVVCSFFSSWLKSYHIVMKSSAKGLHPTSPLTPWWIKESSASSMISMISYYVKKLHNFPTLHFGMITWAFRTVAIYGITPGCRSASMSRCKRNPDERNRWIRQW